MNFNIFFTSDRLIFVLWIYELFLPNLCLKRCICFLIVSAFELPTGWFNVYHILVVLTDSSFVHYAFSVKHILFRKFDLFLQLHLHFSFSLEVLCFFFRFIIVFDISVSKLGMRGYNILVIFLLKILSRLPDFEKCI